MKKEKLTNLIANFSTWVPKVTFKIIYLKIKKVEKNSTFFIGPLRLPPYFLIT